MDRKWMDILNDSPDATIGAALVRLARMAADTHELETLLLDGTDAIDEPGTDAPAPGSIAVARRTAAHPMAIDLPLTTGVSR